MIGDHVQGCVSEFNSEEECKTNLWTFVSKFTEDTPETLQKLFKRAKKEMTSSQEQVGTYTNNS